MIIISTKNVRCQHVIRKKELDMKLWFSTFIEGRLIKFYTLRYDSMFEQIKKKKNL